LNAKDLLRDGITLRGLLWTLFVCLGVGFSVGVCATGCGGRNTNRAAECAAEGIGASTPREAAEKIARCMIRNECKEPIEESNDAGK